MKKIIRTALLCAFVPWCEAQTKAVLKTPSTNALTEALATGSTTLTVSATGTIAWTAGATLSGASDFRTAAGLAIGSNVQAYDSDLTTWAGITPGTGVATALAQAVTGSGSIVLATSPTITTPTISGAIAFPDGTRQIFNPDGTNAGLNVGSHAGDPSAPSNGDLWYDSGSNELTARINGANVALGAGGGGGVSIGTAGSDNGVNTGGALGTIDLSGGDASASNNGGAGGYVSMIGGDASGIYYGGAAGTIKTDGGTSAGAANGGLGGNLWTFGHAGGNAGGSLYIYGNSSGAGGSITTYGGGGSLNTRGTGSLELGANGTRTTLTGSASTNRSIALPNVSGTVITTGDSGTVTNAMLADADLTTWAGITPGTGVATALAQAVSGSGSIVLGTSPTIATPTISGAITLPDGVRQTFNPDATNSGLNVGSHAGDPSAPSNGDLWYDSVANELTARINGANIALGAGGGGSGLTIGTSTITSGTSGRVLYDNAGVVGELTTTGSGAAVLATSPTLVTPALGTPSSGTLTNATGLPVSTGISGLGTGVATLLATPSSANLAAAITDETGTGAVVLATSPTLVTPALGTPSSGVMTNVTGTAASLTAGQATAALGVKTATTTVAVDSATAPSSGQVLTATSSTAATWQTPSSGGGKVAQVISATTATETSISTTIPDDNTKPQNTEGQEVLTANITPQNASSTLIIEFDGWGSTGSKAIVALFVDSTADALCATIVTPNGVGYPGLYRLKYVVSAGSTSARTYKIRLGPTSGNAYLNYVNGNPTFSTAKQANLTVTEILP